MLTNQSALTRFADAEMAVPPVLQARQLAGVLGNWRAPQPAAAPAAPGAGLSFAAGAARRRGPAAVVSALAVAGLFSAIVFMNVVASEKPKHHLVTVNLSLDAPTPEQPTPKPQAQPDKAVPQDQAPSLTPPVAAPAVQQPQPVAAAIPVVASAPVAAPAPVVAAAPAAPAAAPAPAGPVSGGDLSAKRIVTVNPVYPLESRRQREMGTVVLNLLLGTDGRVSEISVATSSGFARLDRAALDAVRKWRWAPTTRNGEPVMVRGIVPIPFVLAG